MSSTTRRSAHELALAALLSLVPLAAARAADPYPAMAPLSEYLMADRAAEIALARSAAPPAIAAKAEVLVLGDHGYSTAAPGSNGFVCLVERAWFSLQDDQFWNPKLRGPDCYNPQAARSVLPTLLERTKWVLEGVPKAEVFRRTRAAKAAGAIPARETGSMNFMLSKNGYLGDDVDPYTVFFVPVAAWSDGTPDETASAHSM